MSIFILSESAGVLFKGAFSLWGSLKLILLQALETISIWMCHALWEHFCCFCMYTKTASNNSQLLKETTSVVKFTLLICLQVQWYADLSFSTLSAYISMLLVHFLGNFPSVRLVDQWKRQMEMIFYSRCYIMESGVGILARKIMLAMTVVVESWITHCSLDPMVWQSSFHCLD